MLSGIVLKFLVDELQNLVMQRVQKIRRKEKIYQFKSKEESLFISIDSQQPIIAKAQLDFEGEDIMRKLWRNRIFAIEAIGWERIVKITIGREELFFFLAKGARLSSTMITLPDDDRLNPDQAVDEEFETPEEIIAKVRGIDLALARHIITDIPLAKIMEGIKKGTMRYEMATNTILPSTDGQYQDINQAAQQLIRRLIISNEQKEEARKEKLIEKQRNRIRKRIAHIGDPEIQRRKGDAILAYQNLVKKGEGKIELPDPENPEQKLAIEIDPRLSPQKLAQRYYKKYRKQKRALVHLKKILKKPVRIKTKQEKSPPYHSFYTDNGFEILVGKNTHSNQMITFEIARPKDIFFHVRGFPGAHVILRTKGAKPTKKDIQQAASYAVRFSKARYSTYVPVSYALRADIKKGKQPGVVIIKKETVIFADPAQP